MKSDTKPLVSIIVPTFNEEEDIRKTLDACVAVEYPKKEIIVVDDSRDATPNIVKEYENRGVRLIHREKNIGGRSGARNVGILEAKGEIVIILNADVLLPRDFILRILKHYQDGAGYVLVESKVINQEHLFPRFLASFHTLTYSNSKNDRTNYWTEGYSCLREATLKAGLFPQPPITIKAGEDGYFGKKIDDLGYRKVIDRSILVTHYAPYRFGEFFRIMSERVSAPASYFLEKRPMIAIFARTLARTIVTLTTIFTILPLLIIAARLSQYSPKKSKDVLPFTYAHTIQAIAFLMGKWTSFYELLKYKIFT